MVESGKLLCTVAILGAVIWAVATPGQDRNVYVEGGAATAGASRPVCTTGSKRVAASILHLRTHPGGKAVIVGTLVRGARVVVSSCWVDWAKIGPGLWVSARYLDDPRRAPASKKAD